MSESWWVVGFEEGLGEAQARMRRELPRKPVRAALEWLERARGAVEDEMPEPTEPFEATVVGDED